MSARGVHLVGSVPLASTEAVFRAVSEALGSHIRRLPDGETGERNMWIAQQVPILARNPAFAMRGAGLVRSALRTYARSPLARAVTNRAAVWWGSRDVPRLIRVRAGARPEEIAIGPLGYAEHAQRSFAVFSRLQADGTIPRHVRFQVTLPTPLAGLLFFAPHEMAVVEPAYEERLLAELDEIATAVPHDKLAIQWDVAVELAMLEGMWQSPYGSPAQSFEPISSLLPRLGNHVPAGVELGFHLCYGDLGHRHFVQPRDTSLMVSLVNEVVRGLARPIDWLHLPVPRDRPDEAYLAPARDLLVGQDTELYLGLVHLTDGLEGARRRAAAAQRVLGREFGIATECGLGRRQPSTIPDLLRLHAQLADPITSADLSSARRPMRRMSPDRGVAR